VRERCQKEWKTKRKVRKELRKTEKERNLDLVVPFLCSELWELCSQYSELQKSCSWYSVYDGNMVIGTQSMTNYYGWYLGYNGGLLYTRMEYTASTRGHEGLRGWYSFNGSIYLNEGLQLVTQWSGRPRMVRSAW